ncbi:MAG TPA: hypothetical protein VHC95_01225 [Opitutales bacterium]|nr:hypothetical protein [Opitutales bacterium]
MKIFPTLLLAAGIAGAGFAAGYWAGRRPGATPATTAVRPKNPSGAFRAILIAGSSAENVDWQTLLKSTNKVDPNLLDAWARSLGQSDILATLQALRLEPANRRRDDLMGALYNAWAEQDPKGFLAARGDVPVPRLREEGVDAALKSWAAQDPKSALDWIKNNPGVASAAAEQERFAAAIAGFAANDPLAAVGLVSSLSDANARDAGLKKAAIKSLADALSDQGQFMQAASFFSHLPAGQTREDAYAQLAQRWSESAPLDAAAWVEGINGDPQLKAAMGIKVAETWAELDPVAAATWAAKTDLATPGVNSADNSSTNGQLLATAIRSWSDYDLNSVGEFLNQLPNSPAKDPSVAIFALRASQENPQDVFTWVNTISDDQLRMRVTAAVALQWMQQDPDGYKQFLGNTTLLTDDQKKMLMDMPPEALGGLTQFNNLVGGGDSAQKILESTIIKESDGTNRNAPPPGN